MHAQSTYSPLSLRYIAALRGHKPPATNAAFAYAEIACRAPENLICLAASNPMGRFYGFVADEAARARAEEASAQRSVFNVVFLTGTPSDILAKIDNGSSLPPMLDYLCCDESETSLPSAEREALFDLAAKRLNPGGLFVATYPSSDREGGVLNFLARELAPEMDEAQKRDMLLELSKLGATYFARHPEEAAKLKDAIVKNDAEAYLAALGAVSSRSAAFDIMVAMGARGLAFAGDAHMALNFVELSIPYEAQDIVLKCRSSVLYEPVKDLALDRAARADIWVRAPFDMSNDPAELFGGFAYGITMAREDVPSVYQAKGKGINLSSPLYTKLLDLMATLPVGVGDFLAHPSGVGEDPASVLEALQILVACGIALPMRGLNGTARFDHAMVPRFAGSFNRYLDKTAVMSADVWLASPAVGCGLTVPAREALVMQALNRSGLSDSANALLPELKRLAENGASVTPADQQVTGETAQRIVLDVVSSSLVKWYGYGLMEAA